MEKLQWKELVKEMLRQVLNLQVLSQVSFENMS